MNNDTLKVSHSTTPDGFLLVTVVGMVDGYNLKEFEQWAMSPVRTNGKKLKVCPTCPLLL